MRVCCLTLIMALPGLSSVLMSPAQSAAKKAILLSEFIYDTAPFPSCHASTIAETPGGLVAAWFGGSYEGAKDVCIWVSHYNKNKWTPPVKAADGLMKDTLRYPCYNPVLYQVPGGALMLFYKIGPNVEGWTGWLKRSNDHGYTWTDREALPPGFLGPIKNKPVLVNGTLLCPSSTEKDGWKAHLEYTADNGVTFTKSGPLNDANPVTAIQPSILQYAGGRLQILCRSTNGSINTSWSTDGGRSWSPMRPTGLPNNNSGTDAVTLRDKRQLLVYNHVKPPATAEEGRGDRTPLNVAVSKDGNTWWAALTLEHEPGEYSYPSVIQTKDGLVHIVYTWKRQRIKHVVVNPAALRLQPIVAGRWPGRLQ
jgi:alpha-L-rhamnosidase